jgi:hypothetical protein
MADGLLQYDELPGLLGPNRKPAPRLRKREREQAEQGKSFWQAVQETFTGLSDPRLNRAAQDRVRQQSMVRAGMAMMASQGGLGEQLAAGHAAGTQLAEELRGQELQKQQQQELQELIGNGQVDQNTLRTLLTNAILTGNIDVARVLSEVLKSGAGGVQDHWTPEVVTDPETGKPITVLVNRRTGEVRQTGYGGQQRGGAVQMRQVVGDDGVTRYEIYDPTTGTWTPTGKRTGTANEKSQVAQFMMPQVTRSLDAINTIVAAPNRIMDIIGKKNWNEVAPADMQMFYAAGRVLGDAYLRITSGAAIKEEEVFQFVTTFLPAPGDAPETLAFKRGLRDDLYRSLQFLAKGMWAELPTVKDEHGNVALDPRTGQPYSNVPNAPRGEFKPQDQARLDAIFAGEQ